MKENEIEFKVEKEDILSEILKKKFSKRFYRFLKAHKAKVLVDGKEIPWYQMVPKEAMITVYFFTLDKDITWPKLDELPQVVYESKHYLIVNKRNNLLTIPTKADPKSLYQQLVSYLGNQEIHILNRLDKETSGLVLVAKDRYAASLLEPTHQHMVRKYLCLVEGEVKDSGSITTYIAKEETSNKRYVSSSGKLAISYYNVLSHSEKESLLEFELKTGRTHQIRVHTAYLGHPIYGDKLYGGKEYPCLCLTSYSISFIDPFSSEEIKCEIDKEW